MGFILGIVGQPQTKNIFLGDSLLPECYYFVMTYHLSIRIFSLIIIWFLVIVLQYICLSHHVIHFQYIQLYLSNFGFWLVFLRVNAPGKDTALHQGWPRPVGPDRSSRPVTRAGSEHFLLRGATTHLQPVVGERDPEDPGLLFQKKLKF